MVGRGVHEFLELDIRDRGPRECQGHAVLCVAVDAVRTDLCHEVGNLVRPRLLRLSCPLIPHHHREQHTHTTAIQVRNHLSHARNAARQEIYSWTAAPARTVLSPGEVIPFRSRLASPPTDAQDVLVRFVNRRDVLAGTR